MSDASRSFNAGYLIAVANMMHLHGAEVEATDVLRELGLSSSDLNQYDLTDYDLEPLRTLFTNLESQS